MIKFDITSVLAFAGDDRAHIDRLNRAMREFRSAGISVEPFWNVRTPYEEIVERGIYHNNLCTGNVLNITMGHLRMVKAAYNRGAAYAMFFEYDVRFLRDRELLHNVLESIPTDFDIAHLDWLPRVLATDEEVVQATSDHANEYWCRFNNQRNASAYAMSRRCMKAYIDIMEAPATSNKSMLKVCDQMFWHILNKGDLKSYVATPCACVQAEAGCHDGYDAKWRRYNRIGINRKDYDD